MTGTFKSSKCHKRNSVHRVNIMTAQWPSPVSHLCPCPLALWPLELSHKGVVVFPNPMKWLSCQEHITSPAAGTESSLCLSNMPFTAVIDRKKHEVYK